MWNRIVKLTMIYAKTNLLSYKEKLGKMKLGLMLLYGFLFLYLGGLAAFFSWYMVKNLQTVHQAGLFIGIILLSNVFLTMFETFISGMNILYYAKDNEYILPLPFKPLEIVAAKINSLLLFGYISEFFLGVIPFVTYGIVTGAPLHFYPLALIVLILIPIFPVILASLIVMIVMSFSKISKNKAAFQIVGVLLTIALGFGISIFFSNSNSFEESEMIVLLFQADGFVNLLKGYFPTLGFAIDTLCAKTFFDSFLALLGLILSSTAIYLVFIVLSQKLYFKGMIDCLFSSSGTSKKRIDARKAYQSGGVGFSYVAKELRTLIRRPIYLTQCVLPSLLIPVMMLGIFYFSIQSSLKESGGDIEFLFALMAAPESHFVVFLFVLGFMLFCSMYIYISITAVSRDGNNAVFMKYIPVPMYQQCLYKAAPNFLFLMISNLIVVITCFIIRVPVMIAFVAFIVMIPFSFLHSVGMLLIDLRKPKLDWVSEHQVVKNNMSIFFVLAFSLLNLLVMLLTLFLQNLSFYGVAGILFVVYTVAAVVLYRYLRQKDFSLADNIH